MTEVLDRDFSYESSEVSLASKTNINRELTRYVFCIGDHIEPNDKRILPFAETGLGGIWLGHSETEGSPCAKRTKFMALRGGIIPIENTPVAKKADHRAESSNDESYMTGKNVPAGVRGYIVYAGDNMNFLAGDRFRSTGLVELTALAGKNWDDGIAQELQLFFFPEWEAWVKGGQEIPSKLRVWKEMVSNGLKRATNDTQRLTAEQMLESARLFETYAFNHIERNRQAIMSQRASDTGGFRIGWSEKARLYANQLDIVLEDERSLSVPASNETTNEILAELREDRKLRMAELELMLGKKAREVDPDVNLLVTETTPVKLSDEKLSKLMHDVSGIEEGVVTITEEVVEVSATEDTDEEPQYKYNFQKRKKKG